MTFVRKIKRGKYVYLAEVQNVWKDGKVRQKHIRYVGKEVDGETVLSGSIAQAAIDKVSIHGPLLLIDAIAKQISLSKMLGEYGDYLLSLAYAHCIAPNSVKKLTNWFSRTDIHSLLHIPDMTYKKLLEALDSIDEKHGVVIQNKIFRALQEKLDLAPEGYFYDVTNAYFYGVKCPIAKKKKKPKSKNQLQIQIGLAITKEEGIPIFHKVFEGNIFDARTLRDVLTLFHEHNVDNAFLIWDRGSSSELNISEAKQVGFEVLCGLALKGGIKQIALEKITKEIFASMKYRVRLKNATFYAKKVAYNYHGTKGYLILCLNEKQKHEVKERRLDMIAKAQELIIEKKKINPKMKKFFRGKSIKFSAIRETELFDGISAIFCTKNLTEKEVIHAYFEKDRIEKAFRTMKGLLEVDKIRFWLTGKVKAHIFICYISYLLLSLLDYKLKKTSFDAIDALGIMESMYKVHITDTKTKNKFVKTVTLSKQQESILKAVDKKLLTFRT